MVERGALLRFPLLIPALAERGHEVHLAFVPGGEWRTEHPPELPPRRQRLVDELCQRYPNVHWTYDYFDTLFNSEAVVGMNTTARSSGRAGSTGPPRRSAPRRSRSWLAFPPGTGRSPAPICSGGLLSVEAGLNAVYNRRR